MRSWYSRDPLDALLQLQKELQSAIERPLGWWERSASGRGAFPPVNVFGDPEGYVIRMEVPGLRAEDLHIESRGDTLRISGKRENPIPAGASAHRRERWGGEFARSLQLPPDLEPSNARASYRDGVLTVRVPRQERARPRQIQVENA